ncbi:Pyruvate/2-oxoacid:ferredoxin oxidoreductase gamma subunit [Bradyrhizobium sp. LA6.10]|uniref:DUF6537 domain-containing protein n=1 Tax=Bradyrhizobium sp. LA6.10 TaxID=3156318 RepID=UPI003392AA30
MVTDEPQKYQDVGLPIGVKVHHRNELDAVQKAFREYTDVSVILYDQPCATERRRLRKRGNWEDPNKRSFINAAVCEGCGDCGVASNCMSIEPLETELGRKRQINQGTCNKDFSCVEGFCPSFVTVEGGQLKKDKPRAAPAKSASPKTEWRSELPLPAIAPLTQVHSVLIAGIGGTGVVTIGQTLAVAAHIDGYFSSNLDVTGLAQKYGAVHSHVRWSPRSDMLHATRIAEGEARSLIGCDLIVAASDESVGTIDIAAGGAVVCTDIIPTAEFARNPDWAINRDALIAQFREQLGDRALLLEGQRLATTLVGDPLAANMFMLGAAWQLGQIPLSLSAIEQAIELNGVAIAMNKEAFTWGRRAAIDLALVEDVAKARKPSKILQFAPQNRLTVDQIIEHRVGHLQAYGVKTLESRYLNLVKRVRGIEASVSTATQLTAAVAHNYHRLLAVKDEWEVARLYTHPDFRAALADQFEGNFRLKFHLGSGPFARRNKATGALEKSEVGSWMMLVFKLIASARGLRGTWLDPFRWNAERELERTLLQQYERDVDRLLTELSSGNVQLAVRIAQLPETIRGYGHVKERHAKHAAEQRRQLWEQWANGASPKSRATQLAV